MIRLSRPLRCTIALLTLGSVLFSQMALAFYQCPAERIASGAVSIAADEPAGRAEMGCDGTDPDQPALCYAHVQVGNQSLDKAAVPHVDLFAATSFIVVANPFAAVPSALSPRDDERFLTRTTAPKISIRNCCLRV